ncbi:hypothetical protein PACTADRAFT_48396 [Pachysolen tannophilus NRRL Y-2460]|uniref:Zn(2)-C6 fungal-type domain-containing protein n=1 Tax=Pachysolen tannophilus NRRL Y-2460 TaxID=669874 RepID=A0A1E4TXQ1_PACTA|nr:hypothetical protein PACTADRAFT_48396 [Pachysolen tannophilus NRRL Y-2460]
MFNRDEDEKSNRNGSNSKEALLVPRSTESTSAAAALVTTASAKLVPVLKHEPFPKRIDKNNNNNNNSSSSKMRVKSGCFCCRKRKKKCDEVRPVCSGCKRNDLKCCWPQYPNQILPKDFKLSSETVIAIGEQIMDNNSKLKITSSPNFKFKKPQPQQQQQQQALAMAAFAQSIGPQVFQNKNLISESETESSPVNSEFGESILKFEDNDNNNNNNNDIEVSNIAGVDLVKNFQDVEAMNTMADNLTANFPLSSFSQWIPNVELSVTNSRLYYYFVNQFIPAITPTHSHPLLAPGQIFIPYASQSPVLREVFFSCGASLLAYRDTSFLKVATETYARSIRLISDSIRSHEVDGTEDWLLVAILTLCLRDRASGANGTRCANHLSAAYKMIKQREVQKIRQFNKVETSVSDLKIDNRVNDISITITPTERTLLESFIFNYSIVLYTCSHKALLDLPSPFKVFSELRNWLSVPIYQNCDVSWMNNPILGSALDEFEVTAKLNWLLRLHYCIDSQNENYVHTDDFWRIITSLKAKLDSVEESIQKNLEKINNIPDVIGENFNKKISLRSNLAVSSIIYHACCIVTQKMIDPSIPSYLPAIQKSADAILEEISINIPCTDHSSCLALWGLYICGLVTIDESQRQFLTAKLIEISNLLCSEVGTNILSILQKGWEREALEFKIYGETGFKVFDLLFDRVEVENISF